jgi:hypothetical protein
MIRIGIAQTTQEIKDVRTQQRFAASEDHLLGAYGYHLRPQRMKSLDGHLVRQRLSGREIAVGAMEVARLCDVKKDAA